MPPACSLTRMVVEVLIFLGTMKSITGDRQKKRKQV